ncbi:MAG: sensor histidine kinase [Stellaceae bacterium]
MSGPPSLRGRLLVVMTAIFTLGVGATLVSYRLEVHGLVRDIRLQTIQAQADAVLKAIEPRPDGTVAMALPPDWRKAYGDPSRLYAYTVFDPAGQPVARSPNLAKPLAAVALSPSRSLVPLRFVGVGRDERAVIAMRGNDGYVAVVSRGDFDRDALADSLFAEDWEQVLILVPFALLALVLIWFVSGWSLRPVARASKEAALVGPANPELRISSEGLPGEIRPLVDAVNGALDRLARAYAAERRLTADAAHELRTPLAVLNLRLQRARISGKFEWAAIERELGQMGRLIGQLMDLARKEAIARQERPEDLPLVNLSRVAREAAAAIVPLAEAEDRRLVVDLPDFTPVYGRADDLRDVIRNLLENALVHGRGTVGVAIRPSPSAPRPLWVVEISDEGDGIPVGQEEAVFERFRKLDSSTPGSGLGLAIVRQVVRNHGGRVGFATAASCVEVLLPGAQVPAASPEPARAVAVTHSVAPIPES